MPSMKWNPIFIDGKLDRSNRYYVRIRQLSLTKEALKVDFVSCDFFSANWTQRFEFFENPLTTIKAKG